MNNVYSLTEYAMALRWADWTYQYSDDFGAYTRGKLQLEYLRKVAANHGPDFVALFNFNRAKRA